MTTRALSVERGFELSGRESSAPILTVGGGSVRDDAMVPNREVVVVPSGDGAAAMFYGSGVRFFCTNTFETGEEYLFFSFEEWREFVESVKRGEFDE